MLTEVEKIAYRRYLSDRAKNEKERITISKDILESLLFETIIYDKENNGILKLPVWSGKVLSKIDLSDVDFEDVAWGLYSDWEEPYRDYLKYMDPKVARRFSNGLLVDIQRTFDSSHIDYSHTNAKIDFSKSFECKVSGKARIHKCRFIGVDLSNNDTRKIDSIVDSNLADTKLVFYPEYVPLCVMSSLENTDMSRLTIDGGPIVLGEPMPFDYYCDLTNTGVNITFNYLDEDVYYISNVNVYNEFVEHLSGCTINGKLVKSVEDFFLCEDDFDNIRAQLNVTSLNNRRTQIQMSSDNQQTDESTQDGPIVRL